MKKRNKKIIIGILAIISIVIIGFFISSKVFNEKKIIDATTDVNVNNKSKVNDVVNTITEIDYQALSSLKEEDGSKAYVLVNLDDKALKNKMDSIIDIANKSKIKITFIENEGISDESKPYSQIIEENGHTVLSNSVDIKNILSKNNVKIIDEHSKDDFKNLNNQDVAFFIDVNNNLENINNRDKDRIFECIFNLKNDYYSFKALI